jgi:hypothetical protein
MSDKLERAEILAPRSFRYFGIRGNPVHELDHVIFRDITSTQPVVHVLSESPGKMLPVNVRHGYSG